MKRRVKKSRGLSQRQRKVVKNKLAGMTDEEAVLQAGYSPKTARHNAQKIVDNPHIQNVLQKLIQTRFPPEYITDKLAEGLDATKIMFNGSKKIITPDFEQRRKYLENVVEWGGYIAGRITIPDGTPLNIENVNVMQVTQAYDRITELTERIRARAREHQGDAKAVGAIAKSQREKK